MILLIALILSVANGYTESPKEYEEESVSHIDYEQDQMPIKIGSSQGGTTKVKRMIALRESPSQYEHESERYIINENNQAPAEDRNWQVKPVVKRMPSKTGRKIHIYLNNDQHQRTSKPRKPTTTTIQPKDEKEHAVETVTKKAPELTTKSDKDIRHIEYADKDFVASGSTRSKYSVSPSDSSSDGNDHHEHVIKEKIKIKHHHHHHHHNHVKTVVKKEPYPVEKIVHVEVPVEKIVEKKVYLVKVPS